jgi:aldehyde dehydrogenase (NAD+)
MAKPASKVKADTYRNYINGEWVAPSSNDYIENRNPADTRDLVGRFPASTAEDVDRAVHAAAEAFQPWRKTPAPRRAEIIFKAGEMLLGRKDEFARAMTREMGKVLKEASGDVQEAVDMTYFIAGEGRRLHGYTTKAELPSKYAMCVREPIGVCGLITPWNFPMAIPSWKILPALVCGNTVVIKPAEDTPLSTYNFVEVLAEAGVPPGVVNIVSGYGEEAGAALVNHPKVRLISFTGSTAVGRIVGQAAAASDKLCSLEMGGKNIVMIMEDADLDLAVEGVLWGAFGTSGQRCTAASRVAVHKKVAKKFTQMLVDGAKALRLGSGLSDKSDVGPVINEEALEKILSYIEIGQREDKAK